MISPHQFLYNPRLKRATGAVDMIRLAAIGLGSLFAVWAMANPIHDAVRAGDVNVVSNLLNEGVNIEDREPTGETPSSPRRWQAKPRLPSVTPCCRRLDAAKDRAAVTPAPSVALDLPTSWMMTKSDDAFTTRMFASKHGWKDDHDDRCPHRVDRQIIRLPLFESRK
jgi:hypothetical protein